MDYNSNPTDGMSKHSFKHEMGIDFTGSGTTDGSLTFGGQAGFDTGDTDLNEGTVFISGSFGTITFGENDSADKLAGGIADVGLFGLNGIGVDEIAERHGKTANQFRYDQTFGAVSIAISAGTTKVAAAIPATPSSQWTLKIPDNVKFTLTEPMALFQFTEPTTDDEYASAFKPLKLHFIDSNGNRGSGIFLSDNEQDGSRVRRGDDSGNGDHLEIHGFIVSQSAFGWTRLDPSNAIDQVFIDTFNAYEEAFDVGPDRRAGTDDDTRRYEFEGNGTEAVPAVPSENEYAFGMSFDAGGITVGLGHDSLENTSVGLGFSTGDIGTNALYVKGDKGNSMGADVSYTMGASTMTLAYSRYSPDMAGDPKQTGIGIGFVHDLGGGAFLNAGFGQVDEVNANTMAVQSNNKASIGLSFTF